MGGKRYNSFSDEVSELGDALERLRREAAREATKSVSSPRVLGVLANMGVDGRLTGADVLISFLALCLGALGGFLFFLAKMVDGYSARDAMGCGADVFVLMLGLVIARAALDILSIPSLLAKIFEIESVVKREPGPQVVREPIFVNRDLRADDPFVGLPNGEMLRQSTIRDFLAAVDGQKGTIWSREEWCNGPDDKKRPGRGVMSQDQWRGLKMLIDEAGLWRAKDLGAFREGFE